MIHFMDENTEAERGINLFKVIQVQVAEPVNYMGPELMAAEK